MTCARVLNAYPEVFGYYGGFSCMAQPNKDTGVMDFNFEAPALKDVKMVYMSYGDNDYTGAGLQTFMDELAKRTDVAQVAKVFHGAHQMYYWRATLEDFCANYLWK